MNAAGFLISRAVRDVARSPGSVLAAVAVVATASALLLTTFWINDGWSAVARRLRADVGLTVFVAPGAAASDIVKAVREKANAASGVVRGVRAVPATEGLERLRRLLGGDAALLDDLGFNPVPPSIEVMLVRDPLPGAAAVSQLAAELRAVEGVSQVTGDADLARLAAGLSQMLARTGYGFAALLAFSALAALAVTVSLLFARRRGEVEIMLDVGATQAFVVAPGAIEGALIGLAGAAAGWPLHLMAAREIGSYALAVIGAWAPGFEFRPLAGAWCAATVAVAALLGGAVTALTLWRREA